MNVSDRLRVHAGSVLTTTDRVLVEAADEIDRLRAELAACKRDAERYRWLRRARMNVDVLVREDEDSVWLDMHGWDLDAYVDAALAAGGE